MNRLALLLSVLLLGLAACAPAAPEPTSTPLPTDPPAASQTPEATLSPTPRATLPPEPTETATFTPSASPTLRPTRTLNPSVTPIPTDTLTLIPSHTFTPSLTPSETATFTPTLTPTASPTLSFTPEPQSVLAQRTPIALLPFGGQFGYVARGLAVGFIDLSRGRVEDWAWDFGDGSTSTWRSPNHVYAAPGKYFVRLTVQSAGQTSRITRVIEVKPRACLLSPKGRVRLRTQPSTSAQTLYFLIGEHLPNATAAALDSSGALWYFVTFSPNGWVLASDMTIREGLCPLP